MERIWSSLKLFNLLNIWDAGKCPLYPPSPQFCFCFLTTEWIREGRARQAACSDLCGDSASSHPSKCTNYLCSHTRCLPKSSVPAQTSVLFVLHHPIAHRRGDPHGHHPILPTLTVEGSTQAASRQEKSLKSSRISNVLHAKASPKAGKAAARKDRDQFPTSRLVHPSTSAQGGR